MKKIIAIEGIDRIGKSTLIKELYNTLRYDCVIDNVTIQKPTIGLNTIDKINYPLSDIRGIMEMRNIGLFEETLFQYANDNIKNDIVIRDRFNLSELAYGSIMRPYNFELFGEFGYKNYLDWNTWFETSLKKVVDVRMIVFVLDSESKPIVDEVVDVETLAKVNNKFNVIYDICTFNKLKIVLHRDKETGLTNIMSHIKDILKFVL